MLIGKNKIEKIFKKIKLNFLNIFFPKECLGCQKADIYLCKDCFSKIKIIKQNQCFLCNKQSVFKKGVCDNCLNDSFLDKIIIATKYTGTLTEKLLHNLKFNFIEDLAEDLVQVLIRKLDFLVKDSKLNFKEKILIPIPLHKKRFIERGFNQSELLGKFLAKRLGFDLRIDLLKRVKVTKQQLKLERKDRLLNLKQAFQVLNKDFLKDKEVYLLDDVLTTGATLNEAAKALKEAGVKKVIALAIAHG